VRYADRFDQVFYRSCFFKFNAEIFLAQFMRQEIVEFLVKAYGDLLRHVDMIADEAGERKDYIPVIICVMMNIAVHCY